MSTAQLQHPDYLIAKQNQFYKNKEFYFICSKCGELVFLYIVDYLSVTCKCGEYWRNQDVNLSIINEQNWQNYYEYFNQE